MTMSMSSIPPNLLDVPTLFPYGTSALSESALSASDSACSVGSPSSSVSSLEIRLSFEESVCSPEENSIIQDLRYRPDLLSTLPLEQQRSIPIIRDLITAYPEKLYDLPADLQQQQEVRAIALVAAHFLKQEELYTQLALMPDLQRIGEALRSEESDSALSFKEDWLLTNYAYAFYAPSTLEPLKLQALVPSTFQTSYAFTLHKVRQKGSLLECFPLFSRDWRIAHAAVEQNVQAFDQLPQELQGNLGFILGFSERVLNNPSFLKKLSPTIVTNPLFHHELNEGGLAYLNEESKQETFRFEHLQQMKSQAGVSLASDF